MGDRRVATTVPLLGVFDKLSTLLAFARETLSDFLELASLETRRAGLGLVLMIVGGLVATIFIVTAWAGLMGALAMYIISLGMLPIGAVIVVAAVNLIAGAGMLNWCVGLSRHLLFVATRRQLAGASLVRPSTRVPTMAAINAAELCLCQSRRNVRQSMDRTRLALRTALVRPSTLVLVAVASGISAFLVSRRLRPSVESVPNSVDSGIRVSSRSLVRTFVSLYGARVLTVALQHAAATWKRNGSRIKANMSSTLATDENASA